MSLFSEGSGMNRTIFQGDVLEKLAEIESESIDCVISSPPYWGLRDYGVDGQLGLEPDFRDYLKTMNDIMVQLKRVLKNTGTCWINLGDSYWGGGRGPDSFERKGLQKNWNDKSVKQQHTEQTQAMWKSKLIENKSRVGIPERFYINCIDDGWIARNHIPWYKANSMPSSVKDRFTNKWESIFFFAKQQKYYFNLDSVREKTITESKPFNIRVRDAKNGYLQQKFGEKYKASKKEIENYDDDHITKKTRKMLNVGGQSPHGIHRNRKEGKADWEDRHSDDYNHRKTSKVDGQNTQGLVRQTGGFYPDGTQACNTKGKNPGDVFFINPRPFPEAHFATFPVDLPTKILKCACPKDGIVLDPFLGSGTVGVAAEQLGLKWCGIELNEEYITLARKRLDPFRNDSLERFT